MRRFAFSCALTSLITIVAPTALAAQSASPTDDAVAAAIGTGTEWLGPRPAAHPDLNLHRTIWQGRGAMLIEQQAAQQTIRGWWPARIADARAAEILDGFAFYLQGRAIERVFDQRYLRIAHHVETRPYVGDHVIWSFPGLRLSRQSDAAPRRYAAMFASLERWLGEPDLQGAMFGVAHLPADQLTADTIVKTLSSAAGQDLAWAFDAAESDVSYALTDLTATSVTVLRRGSGMFTGRSAPRIADFESGDAMRLKVVFANGDTTLASWDGRDPSRTFQFESASPITAAYLDPERINVLDRNHLDNAIVPAQPTNVPVTKWVARWVVWLQHTMLSYGMLA